MKRRFCALLAVLLLLTACGKTAEAAWQEQYDLGVKYLSEGNYEEAIIAFTAAIDIDPKRYEAYLKAAEAYEAMGDLNSARDILKTGYDMTGEEMLKPGEPEPDEWALDHYITCEELTIGGVPFYRADFATAQAAYPNQNDAYEPFETGEDGSVKYRPCRVVEENGGTSRKLIYSSFSAAQKPGSSTIGGVTYREIDESTQYQPEFRGIVMGDPFEVIAKQLGFTQSGIEYILDTIAKDGEGSFLGEGNAPEEYDISCPYVNWNVIFENGKSFYVRLFWQHPDDELTTIYLTMQVGEDGCVDTIWIDMK